MSQRKMSDIAATERKKTPDGSTDADGQPISVLDLVLVGLTNWKLLIFAPIVVGIVTYGLCLIAPETFTSRGYLKVNDQNAQTIEGLMRSPATLDKVIEKFPGAEKDMFGRVIPIEKKRSFLNSNLRMISLTADRKLSNVFAVEVDSRDPGQAQEIANIIIDSALELTKPRGTLKATLEAQIARARTEMSALDELAKRMDAETSKLVITGMNNPISATTSDLLKRKAKLAEDIDNWQASLDGIKKDVVLIGPPEYPTVASWPAKGTTTLLMTVAAFVILYAGLLARLLMRNASSSASAAKLELIRSVFRRSGGN